MHSPSTLNIGTGNVSSSLLSAIWPQVSFWHMSLLPWRQWHHQLWFWCHSLVPTRGRCMEGSGRKQDLELSKNIPASSLTLKIYSGVFCASLLQCYRGKKTPSHSPNSPFADPLCLERIQWWGMGDLTLLFCPVVYSSPRSLLEANGSISSLASRPTIC